MKKIKLIFLIISFILTYENVIYSQVTDDDLASWGLNILGKQLNKSKNYDLGDAALGLSKLFEKSSERQYKKDLASIMNSANIPNGFYVINNGDLYNIPDGYFKQNGSWYSFNDFNNGTAFLLNQGTLYEFPDGWYKEGDKWFNINDNSSNSSRSNFNISVGLWVDSNNDDKISPNEIIEKDIYDVQSIDKMGYCIDINNNKGRNKRVEMFTPDGSMFFGEKNKKILYDSGYTWRKLYIDHFNENGRYLIQLYVDDVLVREKSIMVENIPSKYKYNPKLPYGIYFTSDRKWKNGEIDVNTIVGLNKSVYNIAKEELIVGANIPNINSEKIIFTSWKGNQLIGASVKDIKYWSSSYGMSIGPDSDPSTSMDFIDRIKLDVLKNGSNNYLIKVFTSNKEFSVFEKSVKIIYSK